MNIGREERRMNCIRGLDCTQSVHYTINNKQYCRSGESFWMIGLYIMVSKEILNFPENKFHMLKLQTQIQELRAW